jgi:hypothetical protein
MMKLKAAALGLAALAVMGTALAVGLSPAKASNDPVIATLRNPVAAKVTPWDAMRIAMRKVGGKPFSATYSFDEGHWSYDVIMVNGRKISEVAVNAMTGKTDPPEVVNPADEGKELADDLNTAAGMRPAAAGDGEQSNK